MRTRAENERVAPVRCVDCDTKFRAPDVSAGAELACPACGTAIVVGERTASKRRRARSLDVSRVDQSKRATRLRRVAVVLLLAALALATWVWWPDVRAALEAARDALLIVHEGAAEAPRGG